MVAAAGGLLWFCSKQTNVNHGCYNVCGGAWEYKGTCGQGERGEV